MAELLIDTRVAGFPLRVEREFRTTMLRFAAGAAVFCALGTGMAPVPAIAVAAALTAVCVVSLLLHELGHAAAARWRGIPTEEIRLRKGRGEHRRPVRPSHTVADDAWVIAGGPLASLTLLVSTVIVARLAGWSIDVAAVLTSPPPGTAAPRPAQALLLDGLLIQGLLLGASLLPRPGSDGQRLADVLAGKPQTQRIFVTLPLTAGLDGPQPAAAPDTPVSAVRHALESGAPVVAGLDADGRCLGRLTSANLAGIPDAVRAIDVFGRDARPVGLPGDRRVGDQLDRPDELRDPPLILVDTSGRFLGFAAIGTVRASAAHAAIAAGVPRVAALRALRLGTLPDEPQPPSILIVRR